MACQIEINPQAFGDWVEIANVNKTASLDEKGNSLRIPNFNLGVSTFKRFVGIQVTSLAAKSSWVAGGYIAQAYNFPGFKAVLKSHYLKLNSFNLIELSEHANYTCDLIFYPRTYFEDVQVKVWEYVGEEISFLETVLSEIQTSVQNIDTSNNTDLSEIINKLNTLTTNLDDSYLDLSDDIETLVTQLTTIQEALSAIDTEVITQLNQLDAGIFTLFESLKSLLPKKDIDQLENNLRTRLNLQDEFL